MAARSWSKVVRTFTRAKNTSSKLFNPQESVIVRQPAVATTVPSVSPFPLKLETYLRLANIPYKNRFGRAFSSKGKIPWMEYKDDKVADSNFCIRYLNEKFSVDLDAGLSAKGKGVGHAVLTMLEENTYWTIVYYRWIEIPHKTTNFLFPTASPWMKKLIAFGGQRRVKSYLHGHGIGRHTKDEIYSIACRDLASISAMLDNAPFLLGDKPTLVDTAAFGLLANIVWHDTESPLSAMIRKDFQNIEGYCQRIKEQAWPDWDDEIAKRKAIMYKKK
ncbi:failed axon connections homolog [Actinia tenebrosa]|uniref:Failed axon connections homolog n=1 Tax=Actinia tenebrosa TaxID=6105 RepID=A0A6P8J421_ACTTE|nr:failed axon connections homolog [Actinia tenebrosa]